MVLLLNYLPAIILAIGAFALYKSFKMKHGKKRNRAMFLSVVGTVISMVLLQGLTAGYIPKQRSSEVKIPAPHFESSDAEIENRLRAAKRLGDESEERFNEKTDWRQHKRDEELKDRQSE